MPPPTIDTSVARMYTASNPTVRSARASTFSQVPSSSVSTRPRSHSVASTSSSISLDLVTPVPSSGNPSSTSLELAYSSESTTAADHTPAASASSFPRNNGEGGYGYGYDYRSGYDFTYSDEEDVTEDETASGEGDYESEYEYVCALHSFVPQQSQYAGSSATCLSFRAGERIRVLNRDPSGWWDGEIDGRRGWFPSNYVGAISTTPNVTLNGGETDRNAREGDPNERTKESYMHSRTVSVSSYASRASTASPLHKPNRDSSISTNGDIFFPASTRHTPPLMIPLLHGLQLLQNTALARRSSHYQPAVACIIQCIRALLQQTDCLARAAPLLRRFPVIASERKQVLAELALLVAQSKKASRMALEAELGNYEEEKIPREDGAEEEVMLRLAGQVFSRVRSFLSVVVQCGIELPERSFSSSTADTSASETVCDSTGGIDSVGSGDMTLREPESVRDQYGFHEDDEEVYYPVTTLKKSYSVDEGRGHYQERQPYATATRSSLDSATTRSNTSLSSRSSRGNSTAVGLGLGSTKRVIHHRYRGRNMSLSSTSSFSSFSSLDSPSTPPTPAFPSGPCTAMQVQQALRSTHDSLLSNIAAFIGHVHAHSRAAHASSTGHLFVLVRQIVDVVCRLLTIVDAVMGTEGIAWMKRAALESAKEQLYQMACVLADAVKVMATSGPTGPGSGMEEEEERRWLLKVATDVLKAGSDCVSAVKTCLARPLNAPPCVIVLPPLTDTPSNASSTNGTPEPSIGHGMTGNNLRDEEWEKEAERKRTSVTSAGTILPETLDELHEQVHMGYTSTALEYELGEDTGGEGADITKQSKVHPSKEELPPLREYPEDMEEENSIAEPGRDRQSFIAALEKDVQNDFQYEPIEEEDEIESKTEEDDDQDLPSPPTSALKLPELTPSSQNHTQHRQHSSLEDKLINGELPSLPTSAEDEGAVPLTWALSHDYLPEDVAYNSEGQLVGATLSALVEKLTPHDQIVDTAFSSVFFMTFRLFTTPIAFAQEIISRFLLTHPAGLAERDIDFWIQQKLKPVRLRVSNLLRLWLEANWRPRFDDEALPMLKTFVSGTMAEVFATQATRLVDLITSRSDSQQILSPVLERQRHTGIPMPINPSLLGVGVSGTSISNPGSLSDAPPRPVMTKNMLSTLKARNFESISVLDFDALELARQFTLVESEMYCMITAEEMLELGREGAPPAENVKRVSTFSTAVTGWVSESILGEADVKKRALLVKFFIKLADRCTSLNNFSTPRSIQAALDSSTIARLHLTWSSLAQKSKVQLEALRKLADHARNYHEYRSRLRNTAPPAVPFLGLYLTDLTFCREGNPSYRTSPLNPEKKLINFNKYHKLARIVQDMQRFQVAFNLKAIPEAKQYLQFCLDKAKDHGDLDDLYRRSQLLEPKQSAETPTGNDIKPTIFSWGTRDRSSSTQTSSSQPSQSSSQLVEA